MYCLSVQPAAGGRAEADPELLLAVSRRVDLQDGLRGILVQIWAHKNSRRRQLTCGIVTWDTPAPHPLTLK
jgi:hypothetical protein